MLPEFLQYLRIELNRSLLTVRAYEADLRGFNDFLIKSGIAVSDTGFFIPTAVGTGDVREWMAALTEEGASPASVRRRIQSLRSYFKFLLRRGVVTANPAESVTLPRLHRKLPSIATHDDLSEALDTAASTRDALILELLYGCGLRRAELLGIVDTDINPYSRELRVRGKGNKQRVIPLPPVLLDHIARWQRERDDLYPGLPEPRPLIATRYGAMSQAMLYKIVHEALLSTGASRKSPHTLRHSFATRLLNAGADLNSVKSLLGHASLAATQIYTHLAYSELSQEWRKAHPRSKD